MSSDSSIGIYVLCMYLFGWLTVALVYGSATFASVQWVKEVLHF